MSEVEVIIIDVPKKKDIKKDIYKNLIIIPSLKVP